MGVAHRNLPSFHVDGGQLVTDHLSVSRELGKKFRGIFAILMGEDRGAIPNSCGVSAEDQPIRGKPCDRPLEVIYTP